MTSDHPNAKGQRRHVEEKGPFGKSIRSRKGSSRATRTATPAKKENPTIDGFEAALRYDAKKKAEEPQEATAAARSQAEVPAPTRQIPSMTKEPTLVMLYGFGANSQWAAIDFYESASGGIICEDYERQPPYEGRRLPSTYSSTTYTHARPLTKAERVLAAQYHGGDHWIKVTFDSVEAAKRAIDHSPHLVQGHFVYAEPFRGVGPDVDEPLAATDEERAQGKPGNRKPYTIGPSFSQPSNIQGQSTSTLTRSFQATTQQPTDPMQQAEGSISPLTASSATATEVQYPDLRPGTFRQSTSGTTTSATTENSGGSVQKRTHMLRFPEMPRTVLRPASEALLPQPTWGEWFMTRLVSSGFIPGDIIGNGVPRLENGDIDRTKASFYWKLCYWIDTTLGTDLCGLKDND